MLLLIMFYLRLIGSWGCSKYKKTLTSNLTSVINIVRINERNQNNEENN